MESTNINMEQNPLCLDNTSIDKNLTISTSTVVPEITSTMPEVYSSNTIINWKLIFPNNMSVTDTSLPIAVVRLSPLIIFNQDTYGEITPKMLLQWSPIQFIDNVVRDESNFQIISFSNPILYQNMLMSHQYVSGSPNVSVRLTSNTGISGNLVYTVANNVPRSYYWDTINDKYLGYRSPADLRMQAHSIKSFAVNDVSLVRHGITSVPHRQHGPFIDVPNAFNLLNEDNIVSPLEAWYTEDIMLIYALSDIVATQTAPIILDFIYDFSPVRFETPILPTWFDEYPVAIYYKRVLLNEYYKTKNDPETDEDGLVEGLEKLELKLS